MVQLNSCTHVEACRTKQKSAYLVAPVVSRAGAHNCVGVRSTALGISPHGWPQVFVRDRFSNPFAVNLLSNAAKWYFFFSSLPFSSLGGGREGWGGGVCGSRFKRMTVHLGAEGFEVDCAVQSLDFCHPIALCFRRK